MPKTKDAVRIEWIEKNLWKGPWAVALDKLYLGREILPRLSLRQVIDEELLKEKRKP